MSAEFTTMAVMAEKSMSPRRGGVGATATVGWILKSLSLMAEARRSKTKTKTPGKNATDALSKTLDALNAEHGLEGCPPEQFYGSAARTPGSNGSRQVDAALGRPRAAAAGTMLSTFFRRSTPKTEFHVPTGGARTRGAASAGSSDASGDKKTSTILSPNAERLLKEKADPIMVDLLDDSDEEGKKNEANPAVQNLAPMNLTSEGDEPRRSTRSSRYRSLQHEVGNLSAMFPDSKTKGAVQITLGDLEHLKDGDMLNDQCVDFFLRYIQVETIGKNKPELLERVHFFNSFFYQKLAF